MSNMNRNPVFAVVTAVVASLILLTFLYVHSPVRSLQPQFDTASQDTPNYPADNSANNSSRPATSSQSSDIVTDKDLVDILNGTIGFQNVYVINLPSRTDRLDVFTMEAAAIGMNFVVAPGVDGKTVLDKVLPYGMTKEYMHVGGVGAWRAHLNIFQRMVQNNIQSALVFEDDADWDLNFKAQMLDFARGTRFLLNSTSPNTISPYGDDWDVLWIGHDGIHNPPSDEDRRRWVTHDDPTVIPPEHRHEAAGKLDMSYWDDFQTSKRQLYTRVVVRPYGGWGLIGYAISLRGAKKLLYHQSMMPFSEPVDLGLSNFLKEPEKYSNLTVVAPYPKMISWSTSAGSAAKETDIETHETHGEIKETTSYDLMYSARMNVQNVFMGNKVFTAQYSNEVGPKHMTLEQISKSLRGRAERLDPDEDNKWRASKIPDALFSL